MPDKLTDKEIVKGLECCSQSKESSACNGCPLLERTYCEMILMSSAFNLINRLQGENEQKDRAFENLIEVARLWKEKYNNAKKDLFDKTEQLKTAKAEAYKECIEKVKNYIKAHCNLYGKPDFDYDISIKILNFIDKLAKEMVGDDNA